MLGPGIGGFELVVVALVALLVVGPKDLPVLMRKVGGFMAKARQMASEFRASFDEMARQSELDELRKEVEALRAGQPLAPLQQEAEAAMKDIRSGLGYPGGAAAPAATDATGTPEPDAGVPELGAEPAPAPAPDAAPAETPRRRRRKAGS